MRWWSRAPPVRRRRASACLFDRASGFLRSVLNETVISGLDSRVSHRAGASQFMPCMHALRRDAAEARKTKPRPRQATGACRPSLSGSVGADVHSPEAISVRRRHAAGDVAAAVIGIAATADKADAEARVEVVVMKATAPATTPTTAPRLGRSGGGSQRHGAERSCGNKSESDLTKHGLTLSMMRLGAG